MLCETKTHEELKTLFKILSTHNEIPQPYLQKLHEIVEQGYCNKTPPLVPIFQQVKYVDTAKRVPDSWIVVDESQKALTNSFLKTHMYMDEENVPLIMNDEGKSIKQFVNRLNQTVEIIKYTVRLSYDRVRPQVIDQYLLAFCHRKLVDLGAPKDEDVMVARLTRTRFEVLPY